MPNTEGRIVSVKFNEMINGNKVVIELGLQEQPAWQPQSVVHLTFKLRATRQADIDAVFLKIQRNDYYGDLVRQKDTEDAHGFTRVMTIAVPCRNVKTHLAVANWHEHGYSACTSMMKSAREAFPVFESITTPVRVAPKEKQRYINTPRTR